MTNASIEEPVSLQERSEGSLERGKALAGRLPPFTIADNAQREASIAEFSVYFLYLGPVL